MEPPKASNYDPQQFCYDYIPDDEWVLIQWLIDNVETVEYG